MIVVVEHSEGAPRATLEDARNFKQFQVSSRRQTPGALAGAVSATGVGRLDGEHVWVARSWLESQGPDDPEWRDGLESMVGYAASKGWVSEDGRAVRAHVEHE